MRIFWRWLLASDLQFNRENRPLSLTNATRLQLITTVLPVGSLIGNHYRNMPNLRQKQCSVKLCLAFSPLQRMSTPFWGLIRMLLHRLLFLWIRQNSALNCTVKVSMAYSWTGKSDDKRDKWVQIYLSYSTTLMFQIFATDYWVVF